MKRKESGITLLSLCIALIVMIILAGIALRLGVGDQGIVGMTTNTVEQYTNATDQEQEGLNRFVDEFNSIINGGETTGDSGDEDITLSARPTINVSGWNNQKATVEISTQAGYTTEYKIGRTGPWQTYTGQFSVDNGTTVYARYKDDTGVGPTVSKIVEDTTGPEVQITDLQVNGGEITISVIATDTEIGMPDPPTYNYYIKPQGEQYYESVGHNTTGEFTFTDLQGNTSYDIRVSTTDLAGNQGSITANSQTGSVVTVPNLVKDQNIFFDLNPSGPTQDNVDVTIRVEPELEEPLKLQYSVNGTDNWEDYDGPVEMTDNGRVYARVTDGTEFSNVVYIDVTNIDRTKPDVSADVTGTTSDSITVEVTPNDPSDPDKDDFTYDYYIKEHDAPDSEYKKDNGENNKDGSHIFEGLDQDKDYDIKIEVTDPAGNTTEITITEGAHTGKVPSAEPEDGNMTLSSNPTTPTNKNVTVTITDNLNEGYSIQYSITYVGQSEGPAQDYTGPFEVTDNCTVKAWFTDGTNAGDPATLEIANIDRQAPVASADPASEEDKSQQKTVTVKVTENGSAGFNANQGLNYGWTQSNSTAPEGLTSLPGENADKANEISFTVPSGTGLNGTYYLYVAPVPDKAGNQSEAYFFGPYVFDSSVPRPEFGGDEPGDDYKKEYETEITFPDGDGDEVTDIEYVWTHDKEKPDFDDEETHPTTAEKGEDGSTTIPSPPGETGDDWYLHVKIEDDEGNEEIITKGPYKLDNEGPTVDFGDDNYTDYKKEHTITVTVDDNDRSGPNEDSFKYLWVKGDGTPTDDDIKNNGESFNNGEGIKTPSNATGDDYYLWVYVEDNLGNSTKDKIGPVYVDNTAPTATFSPDGSTTWEKSHNVTVTPTDGNSGVNGKTIKYQWTQSSTAPDENDIKTNGTKFTLGEDGTATIPSPSNATGNNWYLWIYEEDNAGNGSVVGTKNPFYLDNTAPSLDLSVIGEPSSNTINIKATATDADSQIDSTSYTYYIKETNGGNYGEAIKDGDSHRFTGLKQDTSYTILVEVTDNAGNKISKETTVITGSVAGGDSVIDHTLSDDGWTNKPVDVTLDVSDEYPDYTIEYKEPGDDNWKKYPPETGKITVDKNEDIIVRPVDPSGNPGSESTIQITNIDTVAPTISAKPSEESTPSKSKTITVTATDTNTDENIAGFAAGVQIKYGWSTSSSKAPSYDQTATSNNGQDATTANFSVTTPNVTGTYYLWVQAGSLQDQAGNSNAETHFGPYVLDNQGPSINFTQNEGTNWAKSHTTSVTSDDTNAQITYVWKLASEGEPRDDEYTGTTTSGADITKNSDSGEYILYVKATDSLGNENKAQSGIFRFDNTAPEVTFGTDGDSTPRKEHSTTVNVSNDGLSNIVTRKYLWSTQTSGINEGSFASVSDTFASGETVRGSGYNESYYLWVYVADAAGNIVVTKTNNSFNFDNTLPKITFTPEQNTKPAKSQSTKVSVSDTNLDESSLKYLWTQNDTKPDASQITNPLKNNSDVTLNGETGNRYLWVLALDTANNQVIEGAGPFLLDNTPPSIELDYDGTTNSITVNVTAQDDYSGVASYSYTIQQVGGSYTQTVSGGASHTFEELPSNTTYNITVTVTDGSGNSDSRSLNGIITASIPGGSSAINASINPESWTNTPVTVTLTNNAQNPQNYKIVYKIGQDGIETDYSVPFTVSTNSTVYAWLEDTAGNQGSPAVIDISKIDTKAPTVSAQPSSDGAASQTKRVTVTATDTNYDSNVAGFKANQSLKYAWSTSNTEVPSSFNTATGTNTAGERSISFNVTGEGLTGNYYLWVQAGSVTDRANNSNLVAHFGPYYFDNTAPTLGGNGQITIEEKTSKSISISVPEVVDTGSGAPTSPQYSYYIKKSTDASYGEAKGTTAEQTFEFNDLDDNTNYDIQVTFADNAGNVGSAKTNAQTALVPALNSSNTKFKVTTQDGKELADGKVTNEAVKVEISVDSSTQANYTLQYRIGNTGNFTEYTGPITLNDKATVYARLWDERNDNENVGTATSKAINNIDTSLSDLGVIVTNKDPVPEDTKVTDSEDNPITIPEGFTPQPDPESDTPNEPKVEDGVVIKDEKGNEFVWIPVGTIKLSTGGTATINYDRYAFSGWDKNGTDSTSYQAPIKTTSSESEYFSEALNSSEKNSAVSNHGFYLGRYEAGVSSTSARTASSGTSDAVIIQPNKNVYNFVTQSEARSLAEGMAGVEGYSGTTNLTSSYAWDTALRFLQATGNSSYLTNSSQGNYYNTSFGGTNSSTLMETGQTTAVQHLYDMGGNVYEWTTERYSNSEATKVSRGGFYGFTSTDEPVIGRFSSSNTADQAVGFRVAMFLGEVDAPVKYMDDLQVGDYVAYKPDSASNYSLSTAYSGYQKNQIIPQDTTLSWRVLSINSDGTVNLISSKPTSTRIYFSNATAYNNGVFILNDITAKQYSTSKYGGVTARNIKIEDIEVGMNENGLSYIHSYSDNIAKWGEIKTFMSDYYYPNLYAQEIGSGIDTQTVKK